MSVLFTKPNCHNCNIVKEAFNIKALGIEIQELNEDNIDALADLAWLELVSESDKVMPILVLDDNLIIKGVEAVTKYFKGLLAINVIVTFAIGAEGSGILIDHEDRKPSTNDLIDSIYDHNFDNSALRKGVYIAVMYWNDDPQYEEEIFMKNIKRLWESNLVNDFKAFVK